MVRKSARICVGWNSLVRPFQTCLLYTSLSELSNYGYDYYIEWNQKYFDGTLGE